MPIEIVSEPDKGFYERRAEEKPRTSDNPAMISLVRRVQEWCGLDKGARILDFGCYDGYLAGRLQQRARGFAVGADISHEAAVTAARSWGSSGDIAFVVSDGCGLPISSGVFDLVVCSEILEHVPDLDQVLAELARVMKPGGRLYATMPNHLDDVWAPLRPLCRKIDDREGHLRRMTCQAFIDALATHGFLTYRSHYRGFAASALWYSAVVYRRSVNERGHAILDGQRTTSKALRTAAFAMMHAYLAFDRLFGRYRGSMGIDVAAVKSS